MVEVNLKFQCWLFIFCLRNWLLISCKNWLGELINFKYKKIWLKFSNKCIFFYLYIIKWAGRVVAGWQCFNPLPNSICYFRGLTQGGRYRTVLVSMTSIYHSDMCTVTKIQLFHTSLNTDCTGRYREKSLFFF